MSVTRVCRLTAGAALLGALAAIVTARAQDSATAAWYIAQRVDERRVVVLFGGGERFVPRQQLRDPVATTRTPTPGRLFETPPDFADTVIKGAARVGDRWIVDAGRNGRFEATVDRFVLGYKDCGEAWGIIVRMGTEEAERFEGLDDLYLVARRSSGRDATRPATTVGTTVLTLSTRQTTQLTALVEAERRRTWPEVKQGVLPPDRVQGRARDWYARWRQLDARFDSGEGRLDLEAQAFHLMPDGDPRLFVRARWRIDDEIVYAMTAWIRVGPALTLEDSDVWAARRMRMGEFSGWPARDELMRVVLGVFDVDGDGRGEVLSLMRGYESRNLELRSYPAPPRGWQPVATYSDGC